MNALSAGSFDSAKSILKTLRQIEPKLSTATANFALQFEQAGYSKQAEFLYRFTLECDPRAVPVLVNFGDFLEALGNFSEAEECFSQAARFSPNDPYVLNYLAVLYQKQQRYEEAKSVFEKILSIDSTYIPAYDNLARVLINLGDVTRAEATLRRGLQLDPNDSLMNNNLGVIHDNRNEIAEARLHYERALQSDLNNQEARVNLLKLPRL